MSHTVNSTGIQLPYGNIQSPLDNTLINSDSESDSGFGREAIMDLTR